MDELEAPEYWERQTGRNFIRELYSIRPRATIGLLVACVLMFALTATGNLDELVVMYGVQINANISHAEWWRLIAAMFLHGGLLHIAFNGYALWIIGSFTERVYGHGRFLLIYLVAGITGNLLTYYFLAPDEPSLGASGAIFGIFGAQLVLELQKALPPIFRRPLMKGVLPWIILNLALGFAVPLFSTDVLINNYAHIGGLIGGSVTAWLVGPRWTVKQKPDLPALCGWLLLAFCAFALGCALVHGYHQDVRFIFKHPY